MAAPSIDGNAMPSDMADRGEYEFHPQGTGTLNGYHEPIAAGEQYVRWTWEIMTPTELDWWQTTILAGATWAHVSAELWDRSWTEQSFTDGVLLAPTWRIKKGGLYHEVVVEIRALVPILT